MSSSSAFGDLSEKYSAKAIMSSDAVKMLYFAVLIVLVILIVWYLRSGTQSSGAENYYGYGMPDTYQVLASGPNVRFQQLTGTNQGSTPIDTPTIKQLYPGLMTTKREQLTAMRQSPAFFDISNTLGEYQYASQFNCANGDSPMPVKDSFGNMTYACADGSNPMSGGSTGLDMNQMTGSERLSATPASAVQEELLRMQLNY